MNIGRLEIKFWKDTGKPKFRIYATHTKCRTYRWILKVMSYWTLWVALKKAEEPVDWITGLPPYYYSTTGDMTGKWPGEEHDR